MFPIKMRLTRDTSSGVKRSIIDVYAFTMDENDSYAICWNPSTEAWLTIPVYYLEPLNQRSVINE